MKGGRERGFVIALIAVYLIAFINLKVSWEDHVQICRMLRGKKKKNVHEADLELVPNCIKQMSAV